MYYFFKTRDLTEEGEQKILNEESAILKDEIFFVTFTANNWDDFGFKTDFIVWINNFKTGIRCGLGTLKIGYKNQPPGRTIDDPRIKNKILNCIQEDFFSLFSSLESYEAVWNYFREEYKTLVDAKYIDEMVSQEDFVYSNASSFFEGINDIAFNDLLQDSKKLIEEQEVFRISFLRSTSYTSILYDYSDSARQKRDRTNFIVKIKNLKFESILASRPSTNIHALIGSNGRGKSYILDRIVNDYLNNSINDKKIRKLIIISFSPFDKLTSYKNSLRNVENNQKINYIGLKEFNIENSGLGQSIIEKVKNNEELENEFYINYSLALKKDSDLLEKILSEIKKSHPNSLFNEVNLDNIFYLEQDNNYIKFKEKNYSEKFFNNSDILTKDDKDLKEAYLNSILSTEEFKNATIEKFKKLSSGYQMVIYTLTSLIAYLEKDNLVLYDEPEIYLHPPLLLTYIKLLRNIFIEKNGMGIFATHSPILLQEIPKSCVKIVKGIKNDEEVSYFDCSVETFASSITTINNEIFKLETVNTGYYSDLVESCKEIDINSKNKLDNEKKIDKVISLYNQNIGDEGLAIIYEYFYSDKK